MKICIHDMNRFAIQSCQPYSIHSLDSELLMGMTRINASLILATNISLQLERAK